MAGKPDGSGLSRLLVFETVTDGGFGKTLKFEDGAMLELGRFDHQRAASPTGDAAGASTSDPEKASPAETPSGEPAQQRKKRFTNFHFRKRNQDRNVAGPALAVVDADTHPAEGEDKGKDEKEEEDVGVRVTIRLSALDEEGKELPSPNEQVTYLHIVRFGAPPVAVEGVEEEDKRPWVVKVVKREATVGTIYGISLVWSRSDLVPIPRLACTRSICTRSTVFLRTQPPLLSPPLPHLLPSSTLTLTRPPSHLQPRKTSHRPNVSFVSLRLARSSCCLAGTWSRVANVR